MTKRNGRYGFDAQTVVALTSRWTHRIKWDCTWESCDEFIKWCAENGHRKGSHLKKIKEGLPFGPCNAYWSIPDREPPPETDQPEEELKITGDCADLCRRCPKKTGCCRREAGCNAWYENFAAYWNKHIHREVVLPPEVYRYEHPDLTREGIVFESSCSL